MGQAGSTNVAAAPLSSAWLVVECCQFHPQTFRLLCGFRSQKAAKILWVLARGLILSNKLQPTQSPLPVEPCRPVVPASASLLPRVPPPLALPQWTVAGFTNFTLVSQCFLNVLTIVFPSFQDGRFTEQILPKKADSMHTTRPLLAIVAWSCLGHVSSAASSQEIAILVLSP